MKWNKVSKIISHYRVKNERGAWMNMPVIEYCLPDDGQWVVVKTTDGRETVTEFRMLENTPTRKKWTWFLSGDDVEEWRPVQETDSLTSPELDWARRVPRQSPPSPAPKTKPR